MTDISQFQPLFPEERVLGPLHELAAQLIAECHTLQGQAGASMVRALSPKLRAMNSYYTNKIEGQHTKPAEIERAMKKDFNADAALARKQRVAIAHMEVEQQFEQVLGKTAPGEVFSPLLVCEIHGLLYGKLPEADRVTDEREAIVPGEYRKKGVKAGLHVAPPPDEIEELMDAWAGRYRKLAGTEALLIGAACSHHRLTWIHPFIDGNGRAARLHAHLVLHAMGLTQGLWSPMRGLARTQEQYYARLNNADLSRRNDLDGRGSLSQEELVAFAMYFLGVCLDQVRFMRERLDLASLRGRLKSLLLHLQQQPWAIGSEKSVVKIDALEALHYVAMAGPIERSRFVAMTGLGERTGRRVLASLLDFGVLTEESTRSPVAFGVPLDSLRFLFPNLWPEAEVNSN
ncbi:MAG: cell filamentation protein Fic [Betaproteobacteria bacterium RIFCSPLOWO2_02_FULL_65_24]|nr:MAG: cell filamentation protein Fic [Betaproteobacteria bacterium RIFCSPLOWO2_02_FULL_65_24]